MKRAARTISIRGRCHSRPFPCICDQNSPACIANVVGRTKSATLAGTAQTRSSRRNRLIPGPGLKWRTPLRLLLGLLGPAYNASALCRQAVDVFLTRFRLRDTSRIAACFVLIALLAVPESIADEFCVTLPPITCVVITSDGRTVIDGSQSGIRVRNFADLAVEQTLVAPCRNIHDMVLSPDATKLAVVGGNPGESAWVGMYSWPQLSLIWSQSFSDDLTYAASFNASGKVLAVACHDHSVVLLETIAGSVDSVLQGHSRPVTALAFVNDDTTLLSCSIDQSIRVWDYKQSNVVRSLTNHTQPVTSLAIRPDSGNVLPMVATGSEDKTVRLWQPTIGRLVRFQRLSSPVTALTWTSDGIAIIAGCRDGQIRIIQADTLGTVEHAATSNAWITAIAVHPSQATVVIGDSSGQLTKFVGKAGPSKPNESRSGVRQLNPDR